MNCDERAYVRIASIIMGSRWQQMRENQWLPPLTLLINTLTVLRDGRSLCTPVGRLAPPPQVALRDSKKRTLLSLTKVLFVHGETHWPGSIICLLFVHGQAHLLAFLSPGLCSASRSAPRVCHFDGWINEETCIMQLVHVLQGHGFSLMRSWIHWESAFTLETYEYSLQSEPP